MLLQVRLLREVPVELKAEERELDPVTVGGAPVDQLPLVAVPELVVLVLELGPPDVEEDLGSDVLEGPEGEREEVDQRETELEVRVGDRVADLLAEVEAAEGVEPAEVVDVGEVSRRPRAVGAEGEERAAGDLEVVAKVDGEVLGQGRPRLPPVTGVLFFWKSGA